MHLFRKPLFYLFLLALSACSGNTSQDEDKNNVSASEICRKSCKISSVTLIPLGLTDIESDFSAISSVAQKLIFKSDCTGDFEESNHNFDTQVSRTDDRVSFTDETIIRNGANYRPVFKKNQDNRVPKLTEKLTLTDNHTITQTMTPVYDQKTKTLEVHTESQKFLKGDGCL